MKNLRLSMKLSLGFGALLAIILSLGLFAYIEVDVIDQDLNEITEVRIPSIEGLMMMEIGLREVMMNQKILLLPGLEQTRREELLRQVDEARALYQRGMDLYEPLPQTAEEAVLYQRFIEHVETLKPVNDAIFRDLLAHAGNEAEYARLREQIVSQVMPHERAGLGALEQVIRINHDIAAESKQHANAIVDMTERNVLLAMAGGLVLAALMGLYITRLIATPTRACMEFAESVAGGELDSRLAVDQKDELGRLADSMRHMVAALKAKIAESDEKSRQAAEESRRAMQAKQEAEAAGEEARQGREAILKAAHELQQVVENLTASSEELSAQVEQSSRGAEEQKARVQETATAMDQINASIVEVSRSASGAARSSESTRGKAREGFDKVAQVKQAVLTVKAQSESLKGSMNALGSNVEKIESIIGVINDIADQTNLLALNAAIEAARAGDAGRGFAVVADEVRKLAEKTMTATKEVESVVVGIQSGTQDNIHSVESTVKAIEEVVELSNESGEALEEIVNLAEESSSQVQLIATASEEQSAASEQIHKTVEEISQISAETAVAMTQSSQAVLDLAGQAQNLKQLIGKMQA